MARHYKLPGLMMPAEKMARVAADAQTVARRALTRRSGTIVVQNGDGSKTVIGPGAGADATGSPTGVAEWVGDTTPPGRPTGVSATSSWGTVYCKWDGTLEGGVPADFAYVSVAVGGTEAGRMAEAGVLALDGHEDGTVLDVAFTAWDAARDADGAPAPNASEAATVSVTVSDARAEIDAEVEQAKADAADALERAEQAATDAAEGVQEAKDAAQAASEKADAAGEAADAASGKAQEALSGVAGVTAKVNGVEADVVELATEVTAAQSTADSALSAASAAQQDVDGFKTTVSQTYATKAELADDYQPKGDYATSGELGSAIAQEVLDRNSAIEQSASSITSTVSQTYATKAALAEADTKAGAAADAADAAQADLDAYKGAVSTTYATKTEVSQTADSIEQTVSETYQVKGDYATGSELDEAVAREVADRNSAIEQSASQIQQTVSQAYLSKADAESGYQPKGSYATTAQLTQTASSIEASVAEVSETADAAMSKATEVEQTASGLSATITQVSTVANQAKTAAATAQSTADTAKADAATAQSTADGAVTKVTQLEATVDGVSSRVTTAQSTADSAVEAASEAKQSVDGFKQTVSQTYATKTSVSAVEGKADAAQGAADGAQADLDAYKGAVTKTYATKAEVQQTVQGIRQEVSEEYATKADVDGISIGGTNLLMYTAYDNLSGTSVRGSYATLSRDTSNTYQGRTSLKLVASAASVSGTKDAWQKLWSNLTVGDELVLSFWAKGSVAAKMWHRMGGGTSNGGSTAGTQSGSSSITTSWKRYEVSLGKVTATGNSGAVEVIYGFDKAGTFYLNGMKLEVGNRATDWSPAPEDMLSAADAEATYASKSLVNQTKDQILSEVSTEYQSKDGMSSYATKSYVDQRDGSITSTVSEVQTTADSALTKATQVEQTASGLSVRLTQAEEDVGAAQADADAAQSTANSALSKANQAQSAASTAQSTANTARSAASDAAKTATNYLRFDSSGLCVGDQTAGSLGMNALVAASKISLRSGATELATFSPTLIELGKNSSSSEIVFGKNYLSISNSSGVTEIESQDALSVAGAGTGLVFDPRYQGSNVGTIAVLRNGSYLYEASIPDFISAISLPKTVMLTPNTRLTNYSAYANSSVYLGNGIVLLQCAIILGSSTDWTSDEVTLFTIDDADMRPSDERYMPRMCTAYCSQGANSFARGIRVYPNGSVRFQNLSAGTDAVNVVVIAGVAYRL